MRSFSVDTLEAPVIPFLEQHSSGTSFIEISKFASGQSNPTYLVERGSAGNVLRVKPPGELLRSANLSNRFQTELWGLFGLGGLVPRQAGILVRLRDDKRCTSRRCHSIFGRTHRASRRRMRLQ